MKLFLASLGLSSALAPAFAQLVGKEERDIHVAYIQNAADTYPEGQRAWADDELAAMQNHAFALELVDLKQFKGKTPELAAKLQSYDAVWFGGGNVFYLRWLLRDLGVEHLLMELVQNDLVFAGCSAGAIVAGPTLKHFETADDPGDAPETVWDGLGLTRLVPVPHMDHAKYAPIVARINEQLTADGFQTVPLKDAQVLIINGDEWRVL